MVMSLLAALSAPLICIDPGHPSENGNGTRGKTLTEIRVCWKVSKALEAELKHAGYWVVITKRSEKEKVTNRRRAEIANSNKAALFVRLHCDAGTGSGFATYYPDRAGKVGRVSGPAKDIIAASSKLARAFHAAAIENLGGALRDAGLHADTATLIGGKQGALTGSIYAKVPVVLVEMAVLQNPKDEAFFLAPSGYKAMAKALAAGVRSAVPLQPIGK